jgi:hypothetical protein
MKTRLIKFAKLALAAGACFIGLNASATTITAPYIINGSTSSYVAFFNQAADPDLSAYGALLYKGEQGNNLTLSGEDGTFKTSYTTIFNDPLVTNADARIEYVSGASISLSSVYALVKDGNLGAYLYDISGWNGTDDIQFENFYNGNQGRISHVSLVGQGTSVPDGGDTVALLGTVLAAIGYWSRRRL